ncbi:MAG: substrate-binding domain-containing protein [Spirochaetaceae bacterium]|nr:substrate-binding domain-containing protein [Spirochaetaceae bacterium]
MQNIICCSKKIAALAAGMALIAVVAPVFAGGRQTGGGKAAKSQITVISREEGSGTRTAFVELFEVLDGTKNDNVALSAEITNNTAVMMTSVAGDKNAIGYISLGSLNGTVKALAIDGAAASAAAIKSGAYKIFRPFNIVTKAGLSPAASGFIGYILSDEGQAVVAANGYLPLEGAPASLPAARPRTGDKIAVAGSSSVTPLMEKLREAYIAKYPGIDIEIQQSDSSTGINSVIDGVCDIGMASRELKRSELDKGASGTVIATDGIAVIVNRENPFNALSREKVRDIYLGKIADWAEL